MLARRTEAGGVVHDLHPAEAAVLNTIEAQLEAQLTAPFAPDYTALLDAARAADRRIAGSISGAAPWPALRQAQGCGFYRSPRLITAAGSSAADYRMSATQRAARLTAVLLTRCDPPAARALKRRPNPSREIAMTVYKYTGNPAAADHASARAPTQRGGHGRDAATPAQIPAKGWWQVLKRVYGESGKDNLGLISAGVAYYAFLALVPLLGALVLTYGLVVEPSEVPKHMQAIIQHVPTDAAKLINEQLENVVKTATGKKGLGLALALGLALYGAMKGASAIVVALNVAYEEEETRGFVKSTLVAAAITIGAVLVVVAALVAGSLMGALQTFAGGLSPLAATAIKLVSWAVTGALAITAITLLYRYAPARRAPKWAWATPGSLFAAAAWVAMTVGFGLYASHFGNYNATYGSLGAVVVLLLWLYLSAYVLLLGAELNAELEHQTARDTTIGSEKPLGSRDAKMANEVAA